jgi:hypothetical protein
MNNGARWIFNPYKVNLWTNNWSNILLWKVAKPAIIIVVLNQVHIESLLGEYFTINQMNFFNRSKIKLNLNNKSFLSLFGGLQTSLREDGNNVTNLYSNIDIDKREGIWRVTFWRATIFNRCSLRILLSVDSNNNLQIIHSFYNGRDNKIIENMLRKHRLAYSDLIYLHFHFGHSF